ncbi:MAG: acyltransferase family protein [Blautia sp.]
MLSKRNIHIDVLKGIATICVIIAHASQRANGNSQAIICKLINSFHMALFMLIAGYLFGMTIVEKQKIDLRTIEKKIKIYIWPTIIWSYIIFGMRDLQFTGIQPFIQLPDSMFQFTMLLLKNPGYIIWFMWTLFVCEVVLMFAYKYFKKNIISVCLIIEVLFILLPQNYYNMFNISYFFPLVCLGSELYLNKISLNKERLRKVIAIFAIAYILLIALKVMMVDIKIMDMNSIIVRYMYKLCNTYLIRYALALMCCAILLYIVKMNVFSKRVMQFLSHIGKYSLEYYVCQLLCMNITFSIRNITLKTIVIFINAFFIVTAIIAMINRIPLLKKCLFGKSN